MFREFLTKLTPSRTHVRVFGLVSLMLMASLAGPVSFADEQTTGPQMVGTASAGPITDTIDNMTDDQQMGLIERFKATAMMVGMVPWSSSPSAESTDYIETVNETDSLETKLDIHANARAIRQKDQEALAVINNRIDDSRNIAWIKAKKAIIEELNSGGTSESAKTRSKTAIRDYYASIQINLLKSQQSSFDVLEYNWNIVNNDANIADSYISRGGYYDTEFDDFQNATRDDSLFGYGNSEEDAWTDQGVGEANKTMNLVNGSTYTLHTLGDWEYDGGHYGLGLYPGGANTSVSLTEDVVYPHLVIDAPTSDYEEVIMMDSLEWTKAWNRIEDQKDQMIANSDVFVDAVYNQHVSGDINASDIVDPYVMASEYTTQYNSTGYYSYAVANNALLGLETPDLGNNTVMNVTVGGQVYQGLLLGDMSSHNDSLTVGEPYTFDSSGTYYLETLSGQQLDLSGKTATILEATDSSGNPLDVVEYRDYNYQTVDASQLEEELKEIEQLRIEIENLQDAALSGGGDADFNFSDIGMTGIGIAMIAAAVLIGKD